MRNLRMVGQVSPWMRSGVTPRTDLAIEIGRRLLLNRNRSNISSTSSRFLVQYRGGTRSSNNLVASVAMLSFVDIQRDGAWDVERSFLQHREVSTNRKNAMVESSAMSINGWC